MAKKDKKTAIFIDGANLGHAMNMLGYRIDFSRFLSFYENQCDLIRAYYYTAVADTPSHAGVQSMVDWLSYNGYTTVTKRAKVFGTDEATRKIKGNMDCEIALGMLEMAPYVDHLILVSGDGDFRCIVEAVQRMGKRVTVISTRKTELSITADELIRQADIFLDLADLKPSIEYQPPGSKKIGSSKHFQG